MTPYQIEILLHYHTRCGPYEGREPIAAETQDNFIRQGLLRVATREDGTFMEMTDRGNAYCEALQCVPLPTACWMVEWPDLSPRAERGNSTPYKGDA